MARADRTDLPLRDAAIADTARLAGASLATVVSPDVLRADVRDRTPRTLPDARAASVLLCRRRADDHADAADHGDGQLLLLQPAGDRAVAAPVR